MAKKPTIPISVVCRDANELEDLAASLPNGSPSESLIYTKWIKLKTVMRLTHYSKSSIYRLIQLGEFPEPVHISPRHVVWRLEDVMRWMSEKEGPANDEVFGDQ
ncbi:hypothetical protein GCM10023116_25030 [Kistimonas scapharcae]|uniref:AlpA family phage regulatory protein n=1 Tax=Kistimonas scapharcae TaxID=1036133 RepID=A0ABP8V2A6_9GAMM